MSQTSDQLFSGFDPKGIEGTAPERTNKRMTAVAMQRPDASRQAGSATSKKTCGYTLTIQWPNVEPWINCLSPPWQENAFSVLRFMRVACKRVDHFDAIVSELMLKGGTALLRLGLGVVFIWFGILKPFGMSPAADLVAKTVYWGVDPAWFVPALGWWEVLIGVCLIDPGSRMGMGRLMTRLGVLLILPQMAGTFLPLFILPEITWQEPFVPTLEGQYIVKNLVLIGAALYLGGRARQDEVRDQ